MRERIASICRKSCLCLLALLPFLIPFNPSRNIDLQGIIILIAGGLAWAALILSKQIRLNNLLFLPMALFVVFCLISTALNPHLGYDLWGAPLVRLGTLAFMALPVVALLTNTVKPVKLLRYLYAEILLITLLSFIYSWHQYGTLVRAGGVFAQADILACIAGCGLLLGQQLFVSSLKKQRFWLWGAQLVLALALALTGTRAVMLLVALLLLFWLIVQRNWRLGIVGLLLLLAVGVTFYIAAPVRSTDLHNATSSVGYRQELWSAGLKASRQKPLLGYGPGNIADALDCRKLTAPALVGTCKKGFFFNSSHNIYLDRVLAVGWFGGLAFLAFVVIALFKGLRRPAELQIFSYAALLIALYYLTNVTSVALELLLWVLLLFDINKGSDTIQA